MIFDRIDSAIVVAIDREIIWEQQQWQQQQQPASCSNGFMGEGR